MSLDRIFETVRFDDDAILSHFLDDVMACRPASLIRLGDGEAKLIGYPDEIDRDRLSNQLRIWFGNRAFTETKIAAVRFDLLQAVRAASYLGLPADKRTLARDAKGNFTRDAQNCQALWTHLIRSDRLTGQSLFGRAEIHKHAQHRRWFAKLLSLKRPFVFVTRTQAAVDRLVAAFGIETYAVHLIPGETWSRQTAASDHYPEVYTRVRDALSGVPAGTIGLVGGGVLGKVYCTDIAAAGGAAFDCGALFDTWANDVPAQRARNMGDLDRLSVAFLKDGAP